MDEDFPYLISNFLIREFKLGSATDVVWKLRSYLLICTGLPQSGSVSQPRVAALATLGYRIREAIQPQRGCVSWRNPFRVENDRRLFRRVEATLGFEAQPLRGTDRNSRKCCTSS
jgi:hypothetical protein